MLAAGLAGEGAAAIITAGGVAWALEVAILFLKPDLLKPNLSDDLQREALWWSIPSLVGALALVGMPLTLGFVTESHLIGGLTQEGNLAWWGAFLIGYVFLVPSLARWLLPSPNQLTTLLDHREPTVAHEDLARVLSRAVGLGLPALLLIVAGLYPPLLIGGALAPTLGSLFAMPGLMGWLLWVVSLVGGGVLAWQEGFLRPRIGLLLSAMHDLLRLEWLYDVVLGALDRGLDVVRAADEVVGGAGALLWSWLLFLLFLLVWGGQ